MKKYLFALALCSTSFVVAALDAQAQIVQPQASKPCGISMSRMKSSTIVFNGRKTGYREATQLGCDSQGAPNAILDYTAFVKRKEARLVLKSEELGERRFAFERAIEQGLTQEDRKFFVEAVMPLLLDKSMNAAIELWLQQVLK